ncbi:MAG: SNF2 helicase-associated domain-containing protein, partial [Acetobacteraceae bacterium]|nr:SNF2 helicase-associated domain-containing protein [Acetobacteraceae bacterium]
MPPETSLSRLGLRLTPHGRLVAEPADDAPALDPGLAASLSDAFVRGSGHGLLQLGAGGVGRVLPPAFVWWRSFAARYVAALCLHAAGAEAGAALPDLPAPDAAERASLVLTAPMMPGAEYLTPDMLRTLWDATAAACALALAEAQTDLQSFLKQLNPAWNLVGRVHFNLAENPRDPDAPFAFMATYTTRLSAQAKAQHVPLGQALREYAGADNRERLLALLLPVQRAAEQCAWLKPMIEAGEIFHPLRWTPKEASRLLGSAADLEAAGVVVRMPASWRASRPARPKVTGTVGSRKPSAVGLEGLLDFRMAVTLDGEPLSDQEIESLLSGT